MVSTRRQARESEETSDWVEDALSEAETESESEDGGAISNITLHINEADKDRLDRLERELERQRQGCCSKFWGIAVPAAVLALKIAEFAFVYSQLN